MAGDPHWDKVVLAMHMDGVGGSTVFTDLKGHAMAAAGTAQISTTQSRFGGASGKFGVSTGNRVLSEASNDFSMGAGPFTIDLFVNPSQFNANKGQIFSGGGGQFAFNGVSGLHYLFLITSNGIVVQYWTGVGGAAIGGALSLNQFTHVEFSKDASGTIRLFINGVVAGSATDFVSPSGVPTVALGGYAGGGINGSNMFTGYLDDIRITKGVCRHTANFTPPTLAFPNAPAMISGTVKDSTGTLVPRAVRVYRKSDGALAGATTSHSTTGAFAIPALDDTAHYAIAHDTDADPYWDKVVLAMHMDGANGSTVFTDLKGGVVTRVGGAQISTAQSKFGGGSLALSGTGQYLSVANTSVGAGDFTVEGFVYLNDLNNRGWLHFTSTASFPSGTTGLAIGYDSTAVKLTLYIGSTPFQFDYTPPVSTWRHFAVVRVGSTVSLYVHGVLIGSTYSNADLSTYSFLFIGGYYSASYLINGYIDDVRITKGVARYQADFAPPERAFRGAMTAGTSNALIFDDLTPD